MGGNCRSHWHGQTRGTQGPNTSTLNTSTTPLTPNDPYSCRTAPLTSKRCILYIYSTNIGAEYFKHGVYYTFFSLQNAICFIILTYLLPVLFKIKKKFQREKVFTLHHRSYMALFIQPTCGNLVTDYQRSYTSDYQGSFPLHTTYTCTFPLRPVDGVTVISYIPVALGSSPCFLAPWFVLQKWMLVHVGINVCSVWCSRECALMWWCKDGYNPTFFLNMLVHH